MKNFTTKLMIAAAALAVAAGVASAQNMKADIPFAFRVAGTTMAPGSYRVEMNGAGGTIHIVQANGKYSVQALPLTRLEGGKEGDAKLVFRCGTGTCSLLQAWSGDGGRAYSFSIPKRERNEETYLSAVRLSVDKGR